MKRKILIWIGLCLSCILVLIVGGFIIWANQAAKPMLEAIDSLASNRQVEVTMDQWLVFEPTQTQPEVGIIFYPGGRVNPKAYAPAAMDLASQGYFVVITPMPLNLAVFAPEKASEVIEAYPEISTWIIGGHSLGGSMAAQFAENNPDQVDGLMLWASYPAESSDLSESDLPVISIFASEDGLATPEKISESETLLPAWTTWTKIVGGNHAQFGWYGEQANDGTATISREQQQQKLIEAVTNWINSIQSEE